MNVAEFLGRARRALASHRARLSPARAPVPYSLGGPFDPRSDEAPDSGLDCSTLVRWAAQLAQPPEEGRSSWRWDTSGIVADALDQQLLYTSIPAPRPGCLIVYPDYDAVPEVRGAARTRHDGHVGIVMEVAQTPDGKILPSKVLHCSRLIEGLRLNLAPGLPRDAVIESDAVWFPVFKPIYAWCKRISPVP